MLGNSRMTVKAGGDRPGAAGPGAAVWPSVTRTAG
jgi:hypothetical protein